MNPAPPVMRTVRVTPIDRSAASDVTRFERPGCPADVLDERGRVDPVLVLLDPQEHRVDQLLDKEARLEPELEQARVPGVVVVLLELDPRVRGVLDRDRPSEVLASRLH